MNVQKVIKSFRLGYGFDIWVLNNIAPEASHLVSIADFHHSERLHQPLVKLQLLLPELWNDPVSEINRNNF